MTKPKKKKYVFLKEIVVFLLCVAAAVYLRSLLKFPPSVNQAFWVLKLAAVLYLAYHLIGFFVRAIKTIIGIALFLFLVIAAGFLMTGREQPKPAETVILAEPGPKGTS